MTHIKSIGIQHFNIYQLATYQIIIVSITMYLNQTTI